MAGELSGVALVTGASRGIGRAVAERLAAGGMAVALAARSQEAVEEAARALGGMPLALDVTDRAAVAQAVARVEEELGPIELLVNNAGIIERGGPAWERATAAWWRVFEVNVLGPFLLMQAVIPRMIERGRGRVINMASQSAHRKIESGPTYSAYMGSKAALTRMTEAVAFDARPYGVTVLALRPGTVHTAMVAHMLDDMGVTAEEMPPETWTSIETPAEVVALIATGALDGLAGRHIDAGVGDWRALPDRIDEILEQDLFALRLGR